MESSASPSAPAPAAAAAAAAGESPAVSDSPTNDRDDTESVCSYAPSELSTDDYHASLKQDLCEALDGIEANGSFAGFATMSKLQPDLSIEGVGPIDLPLGETNARKIIQKARQAPFGKGSETIVDVSIWNTWELDPSQFTIRNPEWSKTIEKACKFVAKSLGIASPVSAELYKMLVYGKGAFFKAHTEYDPFYYRH